MKDNTEEMSAMVKNLIKENKLCNWNTDISVRLLNLEKSITFRQTQIKDAITREKSLELEVKQLTDTVSEIKKAYLADFMEDPD